MQQDEQKQQDNEAQNREIVQNPQDDPRYKELEAIAALIDENRAKEMGISLSELGRSEDEIKGAREIFLGVEKEGTKRLSEQEQKPSEKPATEEQKEQTREPYDLDKEKLRVVERFDDISIEDIDRISAAVSREELSDIERTLEQRMGIVSGEGKQPGEDQIFEVVINKKPKKVTLKELIAHYQKIGAADEYLESSKKAKKEAQRLLEELRQMQEQVASTIRPVPGQAVQGGMTQQAVQQKPAETAKQSPDLDAGIPKEKIKQWVHAIQYGDEEDGARAFEELTREIHNMTRSIGPAYERDSGAMSDEEKARALVAQEITKNEIRRRFFDEYSEIASDPRLFQMVNQEAERLIQLGRDPLDWDVYREAAEDIRSWLRTKGESAARQTSETESGKAMTQKQDISKLLRDTIEEKRRKKLELDVTKSASAISKEAGNSKEPQTEDEMRLMAIEEIAASRGQQHVPRGY